MCTPSELRSLSRRGSAGSRRLPLHWRSSTSAARRCAAEPAGARSCVSASRNFGLTVLFRVIRVASRRLTGACATGSMVATCSIAVGPVTLISLLAGLGAHALASQSRFTWSVPSRTGASRLCVGRP